MKLVQELVCRVPAVYTQGLDSRKKMERSMPTNGGNVVRCFDWSVTAMFIVLI